MPLGLHSRFSARGVSLSLTQTNVPCVHIASCHSDAIGSLNSETYTSIRQQEIWACKRIGYKFYCTKCFIVKHRSKYSCANEIYFNLGPDIIKENCSFTYYFNKPALLHLYKIEVMRLY